MMNFYSIRSIFFAALASISITTVGLAKLNVVAATPDLGSIAEAVGGDRVKVTNLARGTEDPHFVAPRPSFISILNRADVLIEGGAELEAGWLPPLVKSARNRNILPGTPGHIVVARYIDMLDVPRGPVDRSMGDVHGGGNPHFMLDPVNGQVAARVIAERLAQLDPEGTDVYEKNREAFTDEIDERLKQWREKLAPFKNTKVVTYHKNYDYLARRFGFDVFAAIEPLPGIEPSPRHISGLIASMRDADVKMMWMEPFRPRRTPARVAEQTGARIVFLPELVGAVKGTEDYIALIDYNIGQIEQALSQN